MYLESLHLVNFKNYPEASFSFSNGVNCFVGNNGSGKTNLLDAIHYLSLCKSYFNSIDSQNIYHDEPFFVIQGSFINNDEGAEVYCGMKRNQKKTFKRNQKEYERLSDHVGQYPAIIITPEDYELISGGSEERRRFIDNTLSQTNKEYLRQLILYNKALSHRNALLKSFYEKQYVDRDSLSIWDEQLSLFGSYVYEQRKEFLANISPLFDHFYKLLTSASESASFIYQSQLHEESLLILLANNFYKDRKLQYTSQGVHKDDLEFRLSDYPVKKFGSQGQQKTFLLTLKLAQYDYLRRHTNTLPLLLLDDIFDKLDAKRVGALMELLDGSDFGQVFITDTSMERLKQALQNNTKARSIFEVINGRAQSLELKERV